MKEKQGITQKLKLRYLVIFLLLIITIPDPVNANVAEKFDKFDGWLEKYLSTHPYDRHRLVDTGVKLARERKPLMEEIFREDSQQALRQALPEYVYKVLPPEIQKHVETKFDRFGEVQVIALEPVPGQEIEDPFQTYIKINGETYRVGQRAHPTDNIRLRGIKLGNRAVVTSFGERDFSNVEKEFFDAEKEFSSWLADYLGVPPRTYARLEAEGKKIASRRGKKMVAFMKKYPQKALKKAVPAYVYPLLTESIQENVENWFEKYGDYSRGVKDPFDYSAEPQTTYRVILNGQRYKANKLPGHEQSLSNVLLKGLKLNRRVVIEEIKQIDDNNTNKKSNLDTPAGINSFLKNDESFPASLEDFKNWFQRQNIAINDTDERGRSLLHYAVVKGSETSVAEYLLEKGIDTNATDYLGLTPLHAAAALGREEIVKILVDAGASLNLKAPGDDNLTPLDYAFERENTGIARLLIKNGADISPGVSVKISDEQGMTPLHWAIEAGRRRSVQTLVKKDAGVNAANEAGKTPLHLAADQNDTVSVKVLIENGAGINNKCKKGKTPLFYTIAPYFPPYIDFVPRIKTQTPAPDKLLPEEQSRYKTVRMLLENNARVDVRVERWSPLTLAAGFGFRETVELLVKHGAAVQIRNEPHSPLHVAAANGHAEVAAFLLEEGAAPNVLSGEYEYAPLHKAARWGYIDVIKVFFEHGAKANPVKPHIPPEYLEDGIWPPTPLHRAVKHGHTQAVELLINNNADLEIRDEQGRTPLELAREKDHPEIVRLLETQINY